MIMAHGLPKLSSFSEKMETFPDPLGVGSTLSLSMAVFSEVFCSIFLLIGYKTRFFTAPLVITMLVAFFLVHGQDPFRDRELAFMYLLAYVAIMFTGAGKYSLDRK
jgi:putative oxidoreductase